MKHFYTVYNYENEQISLGVNINSKDVVKMINVNENPGLISYATEKLEDEPKVI